MLFCKDISIYFKLFLEDHLQRNCQPYECETGHIRLIDILPIAQPKAPIRRFINVLLGDLNKTPLY